MADLDILRPEVREAINRTDVTVEMFDTLVTVNRDDYDIVRAELLRLQSTESRANEWQLRAERAEAELAALRELHKAVCESAAMNTKELAESRETIKRLNRRVQVAEAGVVEKVKASAPGSLGRALANAAASKAEAELAALKARIADAPTGTVILDERETQIISCDLPEGTRVALVKVEE